MIKHYIYHEKNVRVNHTIVDADVLLIVFYRSIFTWNIPLVRKWGSKNFVPTYSKNKSYDHTSISSENFTGKFLKLVIN